MRYALLHVLVLVIVACGGPDAAGDSGARQACREFRALVQAERSGRVSGQELVRQSAAIHEIAKRSEEEPVGDAARVYAFTLAQGRERPGAAEDFEHACSDIGR